MAVTWTITPTDGVEDKGGGKYVFTPPTTGSRVYTIKYNDGNGNTGSTQYTVNAGDCVTCDCGKISYTATTVGRAGGNPAELGRFKITNTYCENTYGNVTVSDVQNVTGATVTKSSSVYIVSGKVAANTTTNKKIKFNINFNGNTCQKETSQTDACLCSNNSYGYTATTSSIGAEGGTITVGNFEMKNNCDTSVLTTATKTAGLSVEKSGNSIKATVQRNTGQAKTYTYAIKINGSECATYTISQAAGCNCNNYTFTKVDNIPYFSDAQKQVKIGTLSSTNSCGYDGITFTCDSSLLVSTAITSNTVYATIKKNDEDDPVTVTFTMKYNGTTCNSYAITMLGETRVCMVDNCANDDLFTNVNSNLHVLPMSFESSAGVSEEGTCDTAHWQNAFTDYEVVSMEFKDLDMYSDNKYAYVNTTDGWQTVTDQIRIQTNATGCQNSHYCPGHLGCDYLYKRNPSTTKVRWFRIKWGWKPNTWSNASTCNEYEEIPAGTHYKKESWVIGMLAPNGYHWEDANPKYDDYNRHTYKLVEGFG